MAVRYEIIWLIVAFWVKVKCILVDGDDSICRNEVVLVHNVGRCVVWASNTDNIISILRVKIILADLT